MEQFLSSVLGISIKVENPYLSRHRPGRCRMSRDVTVQNAATADFHDHQNIQHPEPCRDRHQEISGHHGLGVIPHEASPVLGGGSPPVLGISISRPVRPHRPGRYQDPELHRQLRRYPLLAPSRTLPHHAHNQPAKIVRNPRSSQPRHAPPPQLESLAMPADEGVWFDNHQCLSPVEESGPPHQRKARRGGELARWNSVFLVEHQLLAQEQYLGTQGSPGRTCQSQELDALGDYSNKDKKQRSEQLRDPEHVHP